MKKLTFYLMSLLMAMTMVGCSSDDEDENESYIPNVLQIRNGDSTESYSVTNAIFYSVETERIGDDYTVFKCVINFNSPYLSGQSLLIINIKKKGCIDAFQPGETFQLDQFTAILRPNFYLFSADTEILYNNATKGTIKLVDKKKIGDITVLSLQIMDLTFESESQSFINQGSYIINGLVDYKEGGSYWKCGNG